MIQFPIEMIMLWGFDYLYFGKSNSLSIPVSDFIPLAPLDQAERDFHALYRQGTTDLVSRIQLLKTDLPHPLLKVLTDGSL